MRNPSHSVSWLVLLVDGKLVETVENIIILLLLTLLQFVKCSFYLIFRGHLLPCLLAHIHRCLLQTVKVSGAIEEIQDITFRKITFAIHIVSLVDDFAGFF